METLGLVRNGAPDLQSVLTAIMVVVIVVSVLRVPSHLSYNVFAFASGFALDVVFW